MIKLDKPLADRVYDELREIEWALEEISIDQDLDVAAHRVAQVKQRVRELIMASDAAAERR